MLIGYPSPYSTVVNLNQLPSYAWLRRPSLPSGGFATQVYLLFAQPPPYNPVDDDYIQIEVAIQGPPGGYQLIWDSNGSVVPGPAVIPLNFTVADDTPQELSLIVIAAIALAGLPFTCIYDNTPGAEELFINVNQLPPPFHEYIVGAAKVDTTPIFASFGTRGLPYNDGRGIVAVPVFPGAPRAVPLYTPALEPPEQPPQRLAEPPIIEAKRFTAKQAEKKRNEVRQALGLSKPTPRSTPKTTSKPKTTKPRRAA